MKLTRVTPPARAHVRQCGPGYHMASRATAAQGPCLKQVLTGSREEYVQQTQKKKSLADLSNTNTLS